MNFDTWNPIHPRTFVDELKKSIHVISEQSNYVITLLCKMKKGLSSIRIDKQYRLEFLVSEDEEPAITICTLSDITNHYK